MTTAEEIIEFQRNAAPRRIWEMDKGTFNKIRKIKEDNGIYLWTPEPNHEDMPGYFLGIQIQIAKERCFQIRYEFTDGSSHVIESDIKI